MMENGRMMIQWLENYNFSYRFTWYKSRTGHLGLNWEGIKKIFLFKSHFELFNRTWSKSDMAATTQNGVAVNGVNGVSPVTEELLNDVHAKLHDEGAKETVLARISTVTKPGITRDEVMDQYSDWVKNSDYEDVSRFFASI